MDQKKEISPIHICPNCEQDKLVECVQCQNKRAVLVLGRKIFYWSGVFSWLKIIQSKTERTVTLVIKIIFFIFGLFGFIAFAIHFYFWSEAGHDFLEIWASRHTLMYLWWLSLIIDLYLTYRLINESTIVKKVADKDESPVVNTEDFDWSNINSYELYEISQSFDQEALKTLEKAWLLSDKLGHNFKASHLLSAMLSLDKTSLVFGRLSLNYNQLIEKLKRLISQEEPTTERSPFVCQEIILILMNAYYQAYLKGKSEVGIYEILIALAEEKSPTSEMLYEIEVDSEKIKNVVEWIDVHKKLLINWRRLHARAHFKPKHEMNRAYTAIATPFLDQVSHDLTILARNGYLELCINREDEFKKMLQILEAKGKGVLFVGNPGVGKQTIVEGLAQRMVAEDVPEILQDKRLVSVSVSALVAGAASPGAIEERLIKVLREVRISGNIILFIDNIQNMIGVGTETGEALDISELLAKQMEQSQLMVVATTTPTDFRRYIEKSSLKNVFSKIEVEELNTGNAIRVLQAKVPLIEGKNNVYFSYPALAEAVNLSQHYIHDSYLPEKAITILELSAQSVVKLKGKKTIVLKDDVQSVVSEMTHIPVTAIGDQEKDKLINLEKLIHERVVDQTEAVDMVAAALRRARLELRDAKRPIASFLFLGPTGVGKTEIAKTVARIYFTAQDNMIRLDMSEYQNQDAVEKLIGRPGATAGYLTEAVNKRPFSLILLDEFEKAYPEILNIFLQVLDDGRLTDASGTTYDFTNTIIIGTSNAGSQYIQDSLKNGESIEQVKQGLINNELGKYFKPELLNRFDGIVVFKPLSIEHVQEIARIMLRDLENKLSDKGIGLEIKTEALNELANLGFDPTLGARPLRRVIQDKIEDQIANILLNSTLKRRDKIIIERVGLVKVSRAEEY